MDEHRALQLAERELLDTREPEAIEICEGATLVWSRRFEPDVQAA